MRVLTGLIFIANLILWIASTIVAFFAEGLLGIVLLIGFMLFLISWKLSGGMIIAPADYFFQPEWDVFKKKLKWSNGIGWGFVLLGFIILAALGY